MKTISHPDPPGKRSFQFVSSYTEIKLNRVSVTTVGNFDFPFFLRWYITKTGVIKISGNKIESVLGNTKRMI